MNNVKEQLIANLDDIINNLKTYQEGLKKEQPEAEILDISHCMVTAFYKEGVYFNYRKAVAEQQNKENNENDERSEQDTEAKPDTESNNEASPNSAAD